MGEAKAPGVSGAQAGFIAEHHAPNGVWYRAVERRGAHPTVVRGCVTAAHGGARPCPGRDPLARPCHRCWPLVARAVERGVEKMNRRADMRGPCGSGCKRRRGGAREWATCWAASWAGRASSAGLLLRVLAGLAGCCALAGRAGRACYGPSFLLYLFLIYFLLVCLISNLV